ncbi:MAG: hypothetical protein Q8N77_03300 [Nanoarchaeota archaeon]|nr:hypothetical protein [Nanoarchaeota archaeon]
MSLTKATKGDDYAVSGKRIRSEIDDYGKALEEYCSDVKDANYVFVEPMGGLSPAGGDSVESWILLANTLTFFALVGEKEEKQLRGMFYKDVPRDIIRSMDSSGIKNFIGIYKAYRDNGDLISHPHLGFCDGFLELISKLEYDNDHEVNVRKFDELGGLSGLNSRLFELGINERLYVSERHTSYVEESTVFRVRSQLTQFRNRIKNDKFLNEFLYFVFSLPREEQNVESNIIILNDPPSLDFVVGILNEEYTKGCNFSKYFEALDREAKESVVESLKSIPERKPVYDSFIWSQGFKNVELDYINLYKDDAKRFIEYFSSRGIEDQKVIIKDVLQCDHVNNEIVGWLEANHYELLREVSFNG